MRQFAGTAPWLALAVSLAGLVGCQTQTRVVHSSWDDFNARLGDPKPTSRNTDANDPRVRSPGGYAVELARFQGADAQTQAFELSARLREQARLADLWFTDQPGYSTVYLGRFRDPRAADAKLAVKQARDARLDGMQPFKQAELVALSGNDSATLPENDLRNHVGSYALQIGYYDLGYGPEFRKAAEDAVTKLRDEGHTAYYYHGPNRSLVALGAFAYNDAFVRSGTVDVYTPAVLQLQQKFPFNAHNGVQPPPDVNAEEAGIQPSFLVLVR